MEQNCAQILAQSLEKKNRILDQIIEQNNLQEKLLKQDSFDMDAFGGTVDVQSQLVEELNKLDEGFETLYERVREEIIGNKEKYRREIVRMQELIQQITDKIVTVNAGNMRNQRMVENQFRKEKAAIRQSVSKSKVARGYYNSMNNLNCVQPQFYDNKK